jgi:hypothetical protein
MKKILFNFLIFICTTNKYINGQQLQSIVPNTGSQGQTLTVSITGANTSFSQASNTVWFSQGSSTIIYATNNNVISNTLINSTFSIPNNALLGYYNVNVYNQTNGLMSINNWFQITSNTNNPIITNVNPNSAQQGQLLPVTITGQNTNFLQATNTTAWFEQGSSTVIYPLNIITNSNTQITLFMQIPANQPTGLYTTKVYNSVDGNMQLPNSFNVTYNANPPQLVSVSPSTTTQGAVLDVIISGQNTHFNQGTGTITWFQQGSSTVSIYPFNQYSVNDNVHFAQYSIPQTAQTGMYSTYTYNAIDGLLFLNASFYVGNAITYFIQTSSNPVNGGTTTGGGYFNTNQYCTVSATPNSGYYFVSWTENGITVSVNSSYTFLVNGNRNLVANFSPLNQYYITTMVNPVNAGYTTGSGVYNLNQAAVVTAIPFTGWKFDNWTENTNIVSTDSVYSFIVLNNRTLVANFSPLISVNENSFSSDIIFPNPVKDLLNISLNNYHNKEINIKLYNSLGELVINKLIQNNTNEIKLDIGTLPKGVYFIEINNNSINILKQKIIVIH